MENCWKEDCNNLVHAHCSKLLLDFKQIPVDDRPKDTYFCGKRCINSWQKKKKDEAAASEKTRIPWETDGSMKILLDWLTTEGNYAQYCGATGNDGTSKTQFHKIISDIINGTSGCVTRLPKHVSNKIGSLESQFRMARDWANATGQGVEDETQFKSAVLSRCKYYYDLLEIMGDRPNAQPLTSNEDTLDSSSEDEDGNVEAPTETAVDASANNTVNASTTTTDRTTMKTPTTKAPKRLTSTSSSKSTKTRKTSPTDKILDSIFADDGYKELREREVAAKEQEAKARTKEAEASDRKTNEEIELLKLQREAQQQNNIVLLLENRMKLKNIGYSDDQLDELLPLPKPSNK